ncbi:MAG: protein phosphatase 2C domain-containing protein [Oligoflexia bacterium]|nr:protein phosphatase 2C domain-containing protein [Oligoflexia bacterium]
MEETVDTSKLNGTDEKPKALSAVNAASGSDVGKTRSENQDSFCVVENDRVHFYAVADGMGGASGGGRASQLAADALQRFVENCAVIDEGALREAVRSAHESILKEANAVPSLAGMGTTLVCLAFTNESVYLLNIGDSRAYLLEGAAFTQLSEDHTVVAELLRSGTIDDEQAKHTPVSHMLTRSLGAAGEVEVDCWKADFTGLTGSTFLLCSDGLHAQVPGEEIATLLAEADLSIIPKRLLELANAKGGQDNVTAIVVRVGAFGAANSNGLSLRSFKRVQLASFNSAASGPSVAMSRLQVEKEIIPPVPAPQPALTEDSADERPVRNLRRLISMLSLAVVFGFGLALGNLLPRGTGLDAADVARQPASDAGAMPSVSVVAEKGDITVGSIGKIENFDARSLSAEDATEKLEQVRLSMDVATRRLLVWIERQSRVQGQQMNELASEIAVTVPSIKSRWDAYQEVRAEYLKQAEDLVYNPLDSAKEARVAELEKKSASRFEEVSSAVKRIVDETVAATLTEIARLTRQRDRLQARLEALRREASVR